MKRNQKSASKSRLRVEGAFSCLRIASFALLCTLASCADTPWPTWLTGEPDPSVLDGPRPVARPAANASDAAWPVLGNVPPRPKDFSPTKDRDAKIDHLARAKADADLSKERVTSLEEGEEAPSPSIPLEPQDLPESKGPATRSGFSAVLPSAL